ncbi:hypothetical protein O3M35_008384 [Rhynocoris fuscipes]|uniref:TBC1 domain family member 15 n=1 Tax=Rhynocoris fuscipes TaxID=488301 RepID=A0AAW1D6R5_9HEMI
MENSMNKVNSCETSSSGREIFSHHGVILIPSPVIKDDGTSEMYPSLHNSREEDVQYGGILSIVSYNIGKCIEWKPSEESVVTECTEPEWAMVNTTACRTRTLSDSTDTSLTRIHSVRIPIEDIKTLRIYDKKTKLLLLHKDKKEHKFFFEFQNADCFLSALRSVTKLKRSQEDKHVYYIIDDTNALVDPFSELNLFHENHRDTVWRYINNFKRSPYETTLSTFSKFTEYLLYRAPECRPIEEDVVHMLSGPASIMPSTSSQEGEEGYHVVVEKKRPTKSQLPPRVILPRSQPLTISQWTSCLDADGRVIDMEAVKKIVYEGGINHSIRYEVWKFLLGYYPWNSTTLERQELRKNKVEEYFKMKLQWRSMTPEQESRFADFRERKNLIEKDVNRTDRSLPFFSGENNPNLSLLYDILMTYVMYNFDLGYVQGMSDLLSPILMLMSNEVDAFWCFVGFMDKVYRNFDVDQSGMKKQLSQLHTLLSAVEPDLAAYLDEHESGNMFFCFRWLLVWFKREFSTTEIMTLWELLWTGLPCSNFHLIICVAILDNEKEILMERGYGFTEILKHINDLSLKISLDDVITKAAAIYNQLKSSTNLTTSTKRVIGLVNEEVHSTSSEDDSNEDPDNNATTSPDSTTFCTSLDGDLEKHYDRGMMFHLQ